MIDDAFSKAASVSSTVNKTVVCKELSAPPAVIASEVAAIETLSGASYGDLPRANGAILTHLLLIAVVQEAREDVAPIPTRARPQPDARAVLAGDEPVAVVLDLVLPVRPLGHADDKGRLHGDDEARRQSPPPQRREVQRGDIAFFYRGGL